VLVRIKEGHGKHHVGSKTYKAGDEFEVSEATFEALKNKFEPVLSAEELLALAEKRADDEKKRKKDAKG